MVFAPCSEERTPRVRKRAARVAGRAARVAGSSRYAAAVMLRKHPVLTGVVVAGALVAVLLGYDLVPVLIAAALAWVIYAIGLAMLKGLAQPVPEPPPEGELRKVKLLFRCSICGAEVRMTAAPSEEPEPPRHCLEDMDLVAPTIE